MGRRTVSPSELRNQHPEEKRRSDFQNHLWAFLVLRPMSFYVAPIFIRLGFSPNQVTIFGASVLFIGLGLMATSTSYIPIVIGAFLVQIWYLLDFVDGVVARYWDMASPLGAFIDWFIGMLYHTLLPFTAALVLYRTTGFETLSVFIVIPGIAWFGLAVIEVLSRLFRRTVIQKAGLMNGEFSANDRPRTGINVQMVASSIESFKSPILLIAIVVGMLDIWLVIYAMYSAIVIFPAIALIFNRLA